MFSLSVAIVFISLFSLGQCGAAVDTCATIEIPWIGILTNCYLPLTTNLTTDLNFDAMCPKVEMIMKLTSDKDTAGGKFVDCASGLTKTAFQGCGDTEMATLNMKLKEVGGIGIFIDALEEACRWKKAFGDDCKDMSTPMRVGIECVEDFLEDEAKTPDAEKAAKVPGFCGTLKPCFEDAMKTCPAGRNLGEVVYFAENPDPNPPPPDMMYKAGDAIKGIAAGCQIEFTFPKPPTLTAGAGVLGVSLLTLLAATLAYIL
jgi:hypothetical protein